MYLIADVLVSHAIGERGVVRFFDGGSGMRKLEKSLAFAMGV